jgi:uncharacterized GH25 family protein
LPTKLCETGMMRFIILTIVLLITLLASAHEFWLQPKKYRYKVGEEVHMDFMVGESFTGEFWDLIKHRAEKVELHRASGVSDLTKQVRPNKGKNLSLMADQEGTYLIALQSNAAFIETEGKAFNDYLKEDGLDDILSERKKLNQLDKPSREFYSRFAKLMVQAGDKKDDTFKKMIGLRYEIVPDQNPYTLKTGDYLQCKVFYEGKVVPHALVKVWSKINNTTFLQNIYTEKDGSIRFPISTTGEWMVSSVKMIKSDKAGAEYHSLWASLVFGI